MLLVEEVKYKVWTLYFYGSKFLQGVGANSILVSPKFGIITMTNKLNFYCTNNMAEYEALVLRLKALINLGVKKLQIYDDSQVIINQINKIYNTKDENLQAYKDLVTRMIQICFIQLKFKNIIRISNEFNDDIKNIASLRLINIEDEETIIKTNSLRNNSFLDETNFNKFFQREPFCMYYSPIA